jgi:hypothetical protein
MIFNQEDDERNVGKVSSKLQNSRRWKRPTGLILVVIDDDDIQRYISNEQSNPNISEKRS